MLKNTSLLHSLTSTLHRPDSKKFLPIAKPCNALATSNRVSETWCTCSINLIIQNNKGKKYAFLDSKNVLHFTITK